MALRDTQELFWRAIRWPTGVADFLAQADAATRERFAGTFVDTPGFPRLQRMEVYADAYFWRLHGVLEDHFPRVHWLMGKAGFHNLATDYVLDRPSRNPDIRQLGARLPTYLEQHPASRQAPWLPHVAAVDWAIVDVLDAEDETMLDEQALREVLVPSWPGLRFRAAATTRLFVSPWSFEAIASACTAGDPSRPPTPNEPEVCTLVWRNRLDVFHRQLGDDEAGLLGAMIEGASFEEMCVIAASQEDAAVEPVQVSAWLRRWLQSGLIAGLET